MALVFNQARELVQLRCSCCRQTMPLAKFPPSCAKYRRGKCTACNRLVFMKKRNDPFFRKLQSARIRCHGAGDLTADGVRSLYAQARIEPTASNLEQTLVARIDETRPLRADNAAVVWKKSDPFHIFTFMKL